MCRWIANDNLSFLECAGSEYYITHNHNTSKVNKNQIFYRKDAPSSVRSLSWQESLLNVYINTSSIIICAKSEIWSYSIVIVYMNNSKKMEIQFLLSFICLPLISCQQSYSVIPVITEQPRDQTVTAGSVAFFSCRSGRSSWTSWPTFMSVQIHHPLAINQLSILVQRRTGAPKCEGVLKAFENCSYENHI